MTAAQEILHLIQIFERKKKAEYDEALLLMLEIAMSEKDDPVMDGVQMIALRMAEMRAHGERWAKVRAYVPMLKALLDRENAPSIRVVMGKSGDEYVISRTGGARQERVKGELEVIRVVMEMLRAMRGTAG
jgi:hypothetical protein